MKTKSVGRRVSSYFSYRIKKLKRKKTEEEKLIRHSLVSPEIATMLFAFWRLRAFLPVKDGTSFVSQSSQHWQQEILDLSNPEMK
jgi:hypothetical protein